MGKVLLVTNENILARRTDLLTSVGASLEELIGRARARELRDAEWEVWTEICELQYLLGEEIPATD